MKCASKAWYIAVALQICSPTITMAAGEPGSGAPPAFAPPPPPPPNTDLTIGLATALVIVGPPPTNPSGAVATVFQGVVSETAQGEAAPLANPMNVMQGLKAATNPLGTAQAIQDQLGKGLFK